VGSSAILPEHHGYHHRHPPGSANLRSNNWQQVGSDLAASANGDVPGLDLASSAWHKPAGAPIHHTVSTFVCRPGQAILYHHSIRPSCTPPAQVEVEVEDAVLCWHRRQGYCIMDMDDPRRFAFVRPVTQIVCVWYFFFFFAFLFLACWLSWLSWLLLFSPSIST
jgi:hypothetical protein